MYTAHSETALPIDIFYTSFLYRVFILIPSQSWRRL
jgi:hypothetical protein